MNAWTAIVPNDAAQRLLIVALVLAEQVCLHADASAANQVAGTKSDAASVKTLLKPADEKDSFHFETDRINGTIRLDGAYHGVSRLVDKRTGAQVIDSRYSALNLFKLMSVNQFMGQPRKMQREISSSKHWVEIRWPATDSHLAEMTARYEVATPSAIDLTVTVKSSGAYRGYELFLSNYFDKRFRPHVYLWNRNRRNRELVVPLVNDVFRGTVLVFPRNAHAARYCVDGRWERKESKTPVVQMCPVRHYGYCLAFMADQDSHLGVVLMARPSDCYAISTRYHADDESDRLTNYSAFDLSLFGDDLRPLDERTVKVRLALVELDSGLSAPVQLYHKYLANSKE